MPPPICAAFRSWVAFALVIATLFATRGAAAQASPLAVPGGRIALSVAGGGLGPLVLFGTLGGLSGEFTVQNVGSDPLSVSRIAIRGSEEDTRAPARITVRFVDGPATNAVLAPGASKNVLVSWIPERESRVRQAFGHVIVTSGDETAGEVAMGFRAQLPTGLGWAGEHVLTFLVLWPLLATLAVTFVRRARRWHGAWFPRFIMAIGVVEVVAALWAFRRFTPEVGRAAGNDGYQLVERFVWVRSAGIEWFFGVDGASMPLVLLAAGVGLVATRMACEERYPDEYHVGAALLLSGVMSVLASLDLVLLLASWEIVWVALVLLVSGFGGARSQIASSKLALHAVIGSVALFLAFVALSRASGATYLVDGTAAAHTMAIPELARTSFAAKASVAGLPFEGAIWVLLLIAVAMATPMVPLHGWLPDALEQSPAATGVVLAGAVLTLGPYVLVRVGLGAVPEGARWAGASVAALGAFGAVWAALCAMVQPDFRRFLAYAAISGAAVGLYGIGSLTPEGIAGGGFLLFVRGLGAALFLGVGARLEQGIAIGHPQRGYRLLRETRFLGAFAAIALGVSAGVPGLAGGWGILLTMVGGFVRYPLLAAVISVSLVISAAAHLRFARRILVGSGRSAGGGAQAESPLEGNSDATGGELIALMTLSALALLLGLWPSPILSSMVVAARDCSAAIDPPSAETPVLAQ